MAFKAYEDSEELRQVQRASVLILEEFIRVCECLDIPYVVSDGTALGAARHRGFIPWDDDIDVALFRNDYERFLAEAPALLKDTFVLDNARNQKDFPCVYSFLGLRDTVFIPEFFKTCPYKKPLTIDIFPFDVVPNDAKKYRKQCRRTWVWGRLMFLRATPAPYLALGGAQRTVVLAACRAAHALLKLFHMTPAFIQHKWDNAARAYEREPTGQFTNFSDRDPRTLQVSDSEVYPAVEVPFERLVVKLAQGYDDILRREYGDYMRLPPVEQRKNHYPYRLDLGAYTHLTH